MSKSTLRILVCLLAAWGVVFYSGILDPGFDRRNPTISKANALQLIREQYSMPKSNLKLAFIERKEVWDSVIFFDEYGDPQKLRQTLRANLPNASEACMEEYVNNVQVVTPTEDQEHEARLAELKMPEQYDGIINLYFGNEFPAKNEFIVIVVDDEDHIYGYQCKLFRFGMGPNGWQLLDKVFMGCAI